MFRFLITCFSITVFFFCCGAANAGSTDRSDGHVLFVDADKILSEALVAKDIRAQMDRRNRELQEEFTRKGKELDKGEEELIKQKSILSSEAFEAKVIEFRKGIDALNKEAESRMSELQGMYNHAMEQVYEKIQQISKRVAEEQGASIVLFTSKGQVSYVSTSCDISEKVLGSLNSDLSRVSIGG